MRDVLTHLQARVAQLPLRSVVVQAQAIALRSGLRHFECAVSPGRSPLVLQPALGTRTEVSGHGPLFGVDRMPTQAHSSRQDGTPPRTSRARQLPQLRVPSGFAAASATGW